MTRSELRTLYWDYLDDPQGGYFTESVANMRLNLATQELQKRLLQAGRQYYTQCVTASTVANQARYALPADFFQLENLAWVVSGSGDTAQLSPIEERAPNHPDVLNLNNQTGNPAFFYFQKNYIVLNPVPASVVVLHLNYAPLTTEMASDSDEPDAPEQYHSYIPALAAEEGFIKDGRPLDPIAKKLKALEELLKQTSQNRNYGRARMVNSTGGMGFGGF